MPDHRKEGCDDEPATLAVFVRSEWLPSMRGRVKPSTWDSYRRNMELHVLPAVGRSPISQLTTRQLNSLYGALLTDGRKNGAGGLSPTTVRYIHVILHGALADAVDVGLIVENPAARAKPPRLVGSMQESRVWSATELSRFLRSCKGHRHRGSTMGSWSQGCMVFPAGPGGGVEKRSGGGPVRVLAPSD